MGKRRKNPEKRPDIVIEIIHKRENVPEIFLEKPTPYRSRNVVYKNFSDGRYSVEQARAIKRGVESGLTGSQIIEISDPNLTPELMAEAIEIAKQINEAGGFEKDDDREVGGIWGR